MKIRILLTALLAVTNYSYAQIAPNTPPRGLPVPIAQPESDGVNLSFQSITVANLLSLVYGEVNQKNYVLSSNVLNDNRMISFKYDAKTNGDLNIFLSSFLKTLGYQVTKQNSVYFVDSIADKAPEDFDYYVYTPKYRTANYLIDNIRPYFPDNFSSSVKQISTQNKITTDNIPPTSPLNFIDKSQEFLSFKYSNDKTKKKILDLLSKFDTAEQNLIVKSYIYEVQYSDKDGSAMGMLLKLASDKLNINFGDVSPATNYLKFSSNTLNFFVSSLETNSNIKLISNPVLRIKNGKESVLTVGNSVPTLGNVSYSQQGQAIQNVEYKDTGLVFKLTPTVTSDSISLDLTQEISEALNTNTGVNNTPTVAKRNIKNFITTKKNEVVMIAGLSQIKSTIASSRAVIFPFFSSKNTEQFKTDIIIFVEVLDITEQGVLPVL